METMFLAFVVFAVVMAGMALGVMLQNKPLKGSCGGLNAVGIDGECEICGGDLSKCDEAQAIDSIDAKTKSNNSVVGQYNPSTAVTKDS